MWVPWATSALILAWWASLACVWALASYGILVRRPRQLNERKQLPGASACFIMPSLVLALLVIVGVYRCWQVNLIISLAEDWRGVKLLLGTLIPAVVLFFASGLALHLPRTLAYELAHWQKKAFVLATRGLGCSTAKALRKIVLLHSLLAAVKEGLPWVFGELVVVECLFNAPGLGQQAWHWARQHNLASLIASLAPLLGLYVVLVVASRWWERWIGERLASYG